ncbi:hypothetical protein IGI04_043102 [Brassica rapa subsp. trilocularis]|uniref:Uncharacterized protein n=1 Tax=Brassica rapa subsp. trilocularis TaxID=1813537 RepID=A0ABQ7KJG5_BRACM|nr:hypothetical protein IGI04_043102 [Brassica rapa subsp. trilocularis]
MDFGKTACGNTREISFPSHILEKEWGDDDFCSNCFRTNTVSGLAKAGCLVAFSLTLFVPGFGDIRKLCVRSNQN